MIINGVFPFIIHVPLTSKFISDSTHTISHWGIVGVKITTDSGHEGFGFTGTHAEIASDRLITDCISKCYAPLLSEQNAIENTRISAQLASHAPLLWVGRGGITQMALSAIDVALWDLRAKHAELPLWQFLGGAARTAVSAYNTDIGWMSYSQDRLCQLAKEAVEDNGFRAVKIKVGHDNVADDLKRLEAVRRTVGPDVLVSVDANGKWDLPTCQRFSKAASAFDVYWFEEPLWFDDVGSHVELARSSIIPIALGESLYSLEAFRAFLGAGAVHYVQPDVTRIGGISEYVKVAHLAEAFRLPVAAHAGEMSQVHQHLTFWHPGTAPLEYIPWIKEYFEDPAEVVDGHYRIPLAPGASTTLKDGAFEQFARPLA